MTQNAHESLRSARDLERIIDRARSIAGVPEWVSLERPGMLETLVFLDDPELGSIWAISAAECDSGDYLPVDSSLAKRLLADHFRQWLALRGWQVQVSVTRAGSHWRLADCLSAAGGGGDRLDEDYPSGNDEFEVLCRAVEVIARAMVPKVSVSPPHSFAP